MLRRLDQTAELVRLPSHLEGIDGLIIPGGESTTIGKLLVLSGLQEALRTQIRAGMPVYGTCAGLILLAEDIGGLDQPLLGGMDIKVRRNAFGRQLESFEETLNVPCLGGDPFPGIFIRAPLILKTGPMVTPLALHHNRDLMTAEQGSLMVSAFHPELTGDTRMHEYFLDKAAGWLSN